MSEQKKSGRPSVGVTQETANTYWRIIGNWIRQYKLEQWLTKPKDHHQAEQSFRQLSVTDEALAGHLNDWCKLWLSPKGWKRLQANARQISYVRGHTTKNKSKQRRQAKQNLQIDKNTAALLGIYANENKVNLNDAILKLLKQAEEQQREVESFSLEHDRYVWRCQVCKEYVVEAESKDKLQKLQSRHKFIDCKGESW